MTLKKIRQNYLCNVPKCSCFDLINKVVVTSKIDRLTVTAASKKKGLKKEVAYDIKSSSKEGRKVVNSSLVRRRLNTISIFKPFVGNSKILISFFAIKNVEYLDHCSQDSMS